MHSFNYFLFITSCAITGLICLALYYLMRPVCVVVQPEEVVLRLSLGRCAEEIYEPGLYFRPLLWLPGNKIIRISRQLEHQIFKDIQANDGAGTTLSIDIWMDYSVVHAAQSMFAIESWRAALNQLLPDVVIGQIGCHRLDDLLTKRESIAQTIFQRIHSQASHWGISVKSLFIQDVRVLPEISKRLSQQVAARIEMKKSALEEEGRIALHTLTAKTDQDVAELQAQAKALHPMAVARAYHKFVQYPDLLDGFQELHQLSLLSPGKMISFVGFDEAQIRALDAMMIPMKENEVIQAG